MDCASSFIKPKVPQDLYNTPGQATPSPYGGFNSNAVTSIDNEPIVIGDDGHGGVVMGAVPLPLKLFLPLLFAKADGSLPVADFGTGAGNDLTYYNRFVKPVLDKAIIAGQITALDANNYKLAWLGAFSTLLLDIDANRTAPKVNAYITSVAKVFNGAGTGIAIPGNKWLYNPSGSFFSDTVTHWGYAVPYNGSYYVIELI